MKLYYSPGACSLATRISLHEAGIPAEFERVDLKAQRTERGSDYSAINPSACVPLLVLNDGETVTENVAILKLIADRAPELRPDCSLAEIRLIEMLSFLSTELHAAFKPYFHDASAADLAKAREAVVRRLDIITNGMRGPYLLGDHFTVADAYLFVMLRWARNHEIELPARLFALFERISAREPVRRSVNEEERIVPLVSASAGST